LDLELWQIIILGVVQGVTEFLPVSSSGHLVIVEAMMAEGGDATVNIVLHAGTLGSILVYYFRRIWRLLVEDRRMIGWLIVGTIPAVVVGLPLKRYAEHLLEDALLAGLMLIVTGLMLVWISRRPHGEKGENEVGYAASFWIGCGQALAILPGISRSGATITVGLAQGLARRASATFSFLLAIPAIAGASILEIRDLLDQTDGPVPVGNLLAGGLVAFAVGILSIWWLVRWLEKGQIQWFAWWCIPVGLGVVVWQLTGRFA